MKAANLRLTKNLLLLCVPDGGIFRQPCVIEAAIYTKYNGAFKPSSDEKSLAALRTGRQNSLADSTNLLI